MTAISINSESRKPVKVKEGRKVLENAIGKKGKRPGRSSHIRPTTKKKGIPKK